MRRYMILSYCVVDANAYVPNVSVIIMSFLLCVCLCVCFPAEVVHLIKCLSSSLTVKWLAL